MRFHYTLIIILTGLFLLTSATVSNAQATKTAVANGNWGSASTWSPSGVPGDNDVIYIPPGITVNVRDDYTLDNAILIVEGTLNMTYRFIFFPLADYASLNFTGANSGLIVEVGGAVLDGALLEGNALFIEIDDVIAWSGDDCSSACGLIDGTFSPTSTTSFPLGLSNPLPVEMISFDAAFESDQVSLNWATASELNNSHFVVQRSLDSKN